MKDAKAYNEYLQPVLKQQANADLQSIKRMFLPKNNKEALKVLWNCLRGRKPTSIDEFRFMLKNDLKKERIIRFGKY